MLNELLKLNEEEKHLLLEVPALITVMFENILKNSLEHQVRTPKVDWNEKIRIFALSYKKTLLEDYYNKILSEFDDIMRELIEIFPSDTLEVYKIISGKLQKLNQIFPKINLSIARELYKSFLKYSEYVAELSGGLLSLSKIYPEVENFIKMEMINFEE